MIPIVQLISLAVAACWFYAVLRYEVRHDYWLWLQDRYAEINHDKAWRRRAYWNIPTIGLLTLAAWPHGWQLLIAGLLSAALVALTWWLLFDGLFNKIRDFGWWFTGSNDPDDAHTDDFLQGLRRWQHIAIKVGAIFIFLTAYILILW